MPIKIFDVSIRVVSPAKVKGVTPGVARRMTEAPRVKKTGERAAVTGAFRLEEKEAEGRARRSELQRLVEGYSELETELSTLLDRQSEAAKDIVYRFDPDVEPELMRILGDYFGTAEPVITSLMYAKMVKLIRTASAELSQRLVVG
jgi:hypothetical protein